MTMNVFRTSKGVEIGKFYQPKPMATSRGTKYELAPHLSQPKPMALTVTTRMRLMRAAWVVWDDWRASRLRRRAAELPGDSGALAWLWVALAVLGIVMAWHMVAR
jgi:hypothetical protein